MTKALLTVSFGTSYRETREKNIDAIEEHLADAFPEMIVHRAWTSKFIIKKVADTEGIIVDDVKNALKKLSSLGIEEILVQPTHLTDGYENNRMINEIEESRSRFRDIKLGAPLLFSERDRKELAGIMAEAHLDTGDPGRKVLILMGHGSEKHPTDAYEKLENEFRLLGYENVVVGTVEGQIAGEGGIEHVLSFLREKVRQESCVSNQTCIYDTEIILAPLMIVAGDHAAEDLAGDGEESWKNRIASEGFGNITAVLKGLGEYKKVREMFVRHGREAVSPEAWRR